MNLLENNVQGTLATGITALATSMNVTLYGNSKSYPGTPSEGTPMYLTISNPDDPLLNEIVKVTAVSGANVTTMVRGQRDTMALAWPTGSVVSLNLHAQDITQFWPYGMYEILAKPSPLAVTVPDNTSFVNIEFSGNNDTVVLTLPDGEMNAGRFITVSVNISDDGGTATKLNIDTGAVFGTESDVANGVYCYTCLTAGVWAPLHNVYAVTPITGVVIDAAAGSEAAPGLTLSDAATGFYHTAENEIGASINGTLAATLAATGLDIVGMLSANAVNTGTLTATGVTTLPAGSAAAPSVNFGTPGTGLYGDASGVYATVGGSRVAGVSATAVDIPAGSEAAPGLNFGTAATGVYGDATSVSVAVSGSQRLAVDSSGVTATGILATTSSGSSSSMRLTTYRDSATHSGAIFFSARGTADSPSAILTNDDVGSVTAYSWQSGTSFQACGTMKFVASENHNATACGTQFQVYTVANTTTSQALGLQISSDKTVTTYGDEVMSLTAAKYFGGSAVNGSWRVVRSSDDLVFERREAGSWVEKFAIED